ncbi:SDH family Clp fold serine proteinase [Bradyrhizobium australafricanum]|uniref:SDH family Clp fold serine proteinase n=1 Tax=Bradyrhizobium australafricanum TaxID=2821406 RepID=UPI001CE25EDB|nr:ATP-dependent Clp protease proteolytic subunit [Bradyrhizobium australafricanum]MCA6100713.1 ATP-dependent Clp protease proteolytic subunit [Bradyrhizobium australafricanum]
MSTGDIVWMFFIFSALQPMLRQQFLEVLRVRKISQIERERQSRVILLVHRQETMRFLGFPLARYIDINDSEDVMRAIQMTDADVLIDLVLHTPGGLVLAALQIAKAVREHKAKVTVFVPHHAMSGGTLIALAADEIVMSKHSMLGPIDPQLGDSPAASLIKVLADKPIAKVDDRTLIMADVGRKAITQVKQAACELLTRRDPWMNRAAAGNSGSRTQDERACPRLPFCSPKLNLDINKSETVGGSRISFGKDGNIDAIVAVNDFARLVGQPTLFPITLSSTFPSVGGSAPQNCRLSSAVDSASY